MHTEEFLVYYSVMMSSWTLLFLVLSKTLPLEQFKQQVRAQVQFRAIKVIHGSLSFSLSLCAYFTQFFMGDEVIGEDGIKLILCVSASFYIFDIFLAIFMRKAYLCLVVHHIAAFLLLVPWLFLPPLFVYEERYFFVAMILTEGSNAPMNLKDILRELGLRFTKLFVTVQKLFFYSFLVSRGLLAHFALFYPVTAADDVHPVFRVSMAFIWGISNYFCWKVGQKMMERIKEEVQMRQKQVELNWITQDQQKLSQLSFYRQKEQRVF